MSQIYTVLLALLGLGFLVFIHELGHYIIAKRQKMKIEVFSIGFGPALFKFKFQDVDWQICPLLFGGYVKIAGMEKSDGVEPYKIKDGFYAKSPWSRIKVALAGPVVNIVFALIAFSGIWILGGRMQSFEENSRRIGWVDPDSALYKHNVRPGDSITAINGKNYTGIKDLLHAGISKEKSVRVQGEHINYFSGSREPFDVTVTPYTPKEWHLKGVKSLGVLASARYLLYNGMPSALSKSAQEILPITSSGIQKGDRIVWAGGRLIFSPQELYQIINDGKVMVTVRRAQQVFHTRVDRLMVKDLDLGEDERDDLLDAKRNAGVETSLKDLHMLPLNLSDTLVFKGVLDRLDASESKLDLKSGDQIIAVEQKSVHNRLQLIQSLVAPKVLMIVKRSDALGNPLKYAKRHELFDNFSFSELGTLVDAVGIKSLKSVGEFHLLNPMTSISKQSFVQKALVEHEGVIENPDQRVLIGVALLDRKVEYNPNPFVMCKNVLSEMVMTFSNLFSGKVSPKWLSGPVGIVRIIHHGFSVGMKEALYWLGLISLNLGIMNLLPIPVLDGGHICFSLYEMIARRRLSYKTQQKLIIPFFALLLFFFVYVTYQDISRML